VDAGKKLEGECELASANAGFEQGMTRRAKRVGKQQEYRRPRFERERLLKGLGKLEAGEKIGG
jgi:hypothetical protein